VDNYFGNSHRWLSCPVCSSKRIRLVGPIDYVVPVLFSTHEVQLDVIPELWACGQCRSRFSQNIFTEELAIEFYQNGDSTKRWVPATFAAEKTKAVVDTLENILRKDLAVLDVGCNTGEFLDFAKSRGCITAGVEFSETSRSILNRKQHQAYASLEDVSERYDVITAFDVVEHLYDVPQFLEKCKGLLADGGIIIILTGNIESFTARICQSRWWYLKLPEHIVFPSRQYYVELSELHLEKWIPTYAKISFKKSLVDVFINVVKRTIKRNYTGLPSLGPDHALIVLKK